MNGIASASYSPSYFSVRHNYGGCVENLANIFCIGLLTFYLVLLILLVWLPCSRRENSTRRLGTRKSKSAEATAPD